MDEEIIELNGAEEIHFTFSAPNKTLLKQGDILAKVGDFKKLIADVHPYYDEDESVTHFQILTQSCDLIRRKASGCGAKYLTIAVIRNIDAVFEREIRGFQNCLAVKNIPCCSAEYRLPLRQLIERLLNNNDSEYFFLRASPVFGLLHDSCTFLPLSIAIKAKEHYQKCLDAKILELAEPFQAKLGWKVGNLYSRIGTIDYAEGARITDLEFEELVDKTLSRYVHWIDQRKFSIFRSIAKKRQENTATLADIVDEVEDQLLRKTRSRLDGIVSEIKRALDLKPEQVTLLRNTLNQNPLIQKAISPASDS